jgi:PAS domain S-box-containing protein
MRNWRYLNPIARLGVKKYSFLFPLITIILFCILSELFAYGIMHNPMIVGTYAIFIPAALILYFSFRDGIRGGLVVSFVTVLYYFYIIYNRHYTGDQYSSGVETTIILFLIYVAISLIIGWLKQTIDSLIDREADEKRRLQTIIEQLPVGIIITDSHGNVVQRNNKLDKILGVKIPLGFKMGQDTLNKIKVNGENIQPTQSPLVQALLSDKQITGLEMLYERKDGKQAYLMISSTPIHNKYKEIIAAASIIQDITQQKELEHQKDDFLNMASHELKTPITSMKMFIDLQARQLLQAPEKARYFNERINDQANRLTELSNDLLDISRIQTGKMRFNEEKFSIDNVITDTIEGLQDSSKDHKVEFKNEYHGEILADKYRIYQVLVNLLTNAIKYTPAGKKISVNLKKEKQNVIVSIKDNGIGIKKEQQKKIFERLYQVTDAKEKTYPGLGLGLYISKNIIDRHKGKIWVESEPGKGSTFYFSLPIRSQKE